MNFAFLFSSIMSLAQLSAAQKGGSGGSRNKDSGCVGTSAPIVPDCGMKIDQLVDLLNNLVCNCSTTPALELNGTDTILRLNGYQVSCAIEVGDVGDKYGILVTGSSNSILGPATVYQSGFGITLAGDGGHTVSRVNVIDFVEKGIDVHTDANTIDKVIVEGNKDESFGIVIDGDRTTVTGSKVVRAGMSLKMVGSFNLVERNYFEFSVEEGIFVQPSTENRILYNTVTGCIGFYAMTVLDGEGHEIRRNKFVDNGELCSALTLTGGRDIRFAENFVSGIGIVVAGGQHHKIERNFVADSTAKGIHCYLCNKCYYTENKINNNGDGGICLESDCQGQTLSGNIISDNLNDGVLVNGINTILAGNTIWGNAASDLVDNGGGTTIIADGNYIQNIVVGR